MPLARRLLSLTGIVPLGAFLLVHLVVQARAVRGEAAYDAAVRALSRLPLAGLLEAIFVWPPLVAHAAIGLALVVTRRPLAEPSPYPRGVGLAMRATGIVALAFLAMHVPELRLRAVAGESRGAELLSIMAWDLSSVRGGVPWRALGYMLGTAAVTFHFAAGLWGAFVRSPRGAGATTRRAAAWAATALGATVWLLLVDVVVLHATGARLFGSAAAEPASSAPCPAPPAPSR